MRVDNNDLATLLKLSSLNSTCENELEIAWTQTRADMVAGRYIVESAEEHVKRLINEYNVAGLEAEAGG